MCGIVYSKSFNGKPVNKTVISRYLDQRTRGTEGFGFYVPEKNRLTHNVREGRILSLLRRDDASEILFHHRFPTSTENVRNACHPFSTKDYYDHNYVVVHNGMVSNDDALAKKHLEQGISYVSMQEDGSFNDSEALAHDIAQYIEGQAKFITARGSIAFICIQNDKNGKAKALYFGRNSGNPLKMKQTKHSLTLSSEGKGTMVVQDRLYCYDYATRSLTYTPVTIPTSYYSGVTYSGNYRGYHGGYAWGESDEDYGTQGYDQYGNPLDKSGRPIDYLARGTNARDYFLREGDTRGYDEEAAMEQSFVKSAVERLKYDAYESPTGALELARDELKGLERREEILEEKEMADTINDEEITEFCEIDDQIALLKLAIESLEREVNRQQSLIGFRTTDTTCNQAVARQVDAVLSSTEPKGVIA